MAARHELIAATQAVMNDERGTIRKDAPTRIAMLYPSPYRAGMSSLGYQILYRELNQRPNCAAGRAFLPDTPDDYRSGRVPVFTYEQAWPIGDVDVVAISFAYELEVGGLLECFDLSGIPLRATDRDGRHPLVILGGPLTFSNPLPVAPFVDVVVMGEAEEVIHEILDVYEAEPDRDTVLQTIAAIDGVYVPAVHGERLKAVTAANNVRLPGYGQIRTPHTELRDMHLVEAERGCHRKCTYCVMRRSTNGGMRLGDPEAILASIPDDAKRVGLVGAAVSDHPKLMRIVEGVVGSGRDIGLSSLRADRLSDDLVKLLAQGGYRTLTVSSDGASERLRIELQKAIREAHLFDAAELAAKHKLRCLKIYMMVGVPGETPDDIDELIGVLREIAKVAPTALGIAPFVAKRNTPMDRTEFAGVRPVERTLERIRKGLRGVVDVRATSARWAWVEYAMAQGGFDMADAAEQAWRDGGGFAAWKRAIREHQRDAQPFDHDLRLGYPVGKFAAEGHERLAPSGGAGEA